MIVTDAELKREVVKDLVGLAMEINDAGIALVFVNYSGHVNSFKIDVDPIDQVYDGSAKRVLLVNEYVHLDNDGWVEKLHNISIQLKRIQGEKVKN